MDSVRVSALLNEQVILNLFRYFDRTSLLTARNVCGCWNDVFLTNSVYGSRLHLNINRAAYFTQTNENLPPGEIIERRLFSNLIFRPVYYTGRRSGENFPIPDSTILEEDLSTARRIELNNREWIVILPEIAEEGWLANLQELVINFPTENDLYCGSFDNCSFPKLKKLHFGHGRWANSNRLAAFSQSLINAAPNVQDLKCSALCDLQNLKKLDKLHIFGDGYMDCFSTIFHAGTRLTELTLEQIEIGNNGIPFFPNVTSLTLRNVTRKEGKPRNQKQQPFPKLKILKCYLSLPSNYREYLSGTEFLKPGVTYIADSHLSCYIDLHPKLTCAGTVKVEGVFDSDLPVLLNMSVPFLVVDVITPNIAELIDWLDGLKVGYKDTKNGILEFRGWKTLDCWKPNFENKSNKDLLKSFPSVVLKLVKRWSVIRFKGFKVSQKWMNILQADIIKYKLPVELYCDHGQ